MREVMRGRFQLSVVMKLKGRLKDVAGEGEEMNMILLSWMFICFFLFVFFFASSTSCMTKMW